MDIQVNVPATTVISTPTNPNLTVPGLVLARTFPGRTQPGFEGGTAIAIGTVDAAGVLTAETLFVEPAENVVLGVITQSLSGDPTDDPFDPADDELLPLRINGMLVRFLKDLQNPDNRITFDGPRNDLGFLVSRAALEPGIEVAVEGYYSATDNAFYAFLLEATGVPAANPALQTSILRAQGRTDRGELDIRGGVSGVTGTGAVNVQIFRVRPNGTFGAATRIGTVAAIADVVPGTFLYRFDTEGVAPFPDRVVARVVRGGVTANSEIVTVDAR